LKTKNVIYLRNSKTDKCETNARQVRDKHEMYFVYLKI